MPAEMKDTLSINELSSLNSLLESTNDFVVNWEDDDEIEVTAVVFNVRAKKGGAVIGAITKYDTREDVKFEPGLVVDV